MKEHKGKSFGLISGSGDGWNWRVVAHVSGNGTFYTKGAITVQTSRNEYTREYYKTHKTERSKYRKVYYQKHRECAIKYTDTWRKEHPEKHKMIYTKGNAKRKQKLGFHPISLPLSIPFHWHHVNQNDVVAIQPEIHRSRWHTADNNTIEGVIG